MQVNGKGAAKILQADESILYVSSFVFS
jgi:hypothetical protein